MTITLKMRYWLTAAALAMALLYAPSAYALIPATADISANPTAVGYGAVVPLTITVTANDDAGKNSEYWIMATDPANNVYTYNGAAWVSGLSTFGSGPLADFTSVINTLPLNAAGQYKLEVLVDFTVNGSKDVSSVYDSLFLTVSAQPQVAPTLKVTVNGSSSPTVTINDTAAIRLQMDPGTYTGTLAEWWIVVAAPDGGKWYYNSLGNWVFDPYGGPVSPTAYGWNPLIAVDTVIVSPNLTLPGKYTVYWGMDDTYDGQAGLVVYATAAINVPGTLPKVGLAFEPFPPGVSNPNMWPGSGGSPLYVDLTLTVEAGDYGGLAGELWIVAIKPDGSLLYYNPDWSGGPPSPFWSLAVYKEQDSLSNLAGLYNGYTLTGPNMDAYGTWAFYILIDNNQNGVIDTDYFIYDKILFFVGTDPQVGLYPFKSPWSISGDAAVDLGVWAYVYPGLYGSSLVDAWLSAVSPVGVFNSLKLVDGWVPGIDYYTQGILDNIKTGVVGPSPDSHDPVASHEGWNYLEVNLHGMLNSMTGTWTVYFGIDNLNGWVDSNVIYDTQTITINP